MPSVVDNREAPLAKRQKLEEPSTGAKSQSSRIFAPFRTLGLVSPTDVPFTSIPLGKTTFQITTSVGKCLHTYDLRRGLNLVFITRPQTPVEITATYAWKDRIFAAWGGGNQDVRRGIWVFKRGKRVGELEAPDGTEAIKQLLIFGTWIVGCSSTRIEVWKSTRYEHYTTLVPPTSQTDHGEGTLSGVICSMPTLLNKILVGKQDGSVELWNLSIGKLVYTFSPPNLTTGPVTALQPSTALDIVAIARSDGSVVLHDLRKDKPVIRLNTSSTEKRPITSISFRSDGLGAGEDGRVDGVMATSGRDDDDVTFWDLNQGGRIMGVLRSAHNPASSTIGGVSGGISKIEFLAGQPVIVTSGRDNSLKSWIFDDAMFSPVPRILHSRGGHAAAITRLEFLPAEADGADAIGKWLLSAGRDQSLWAWSLRRDGQSTEMSQGNIKKKARTLGLFGGILEGSNSASLEQLKAPEITCMACCLNRDGGMGSSTGGGAVWANVSRNKNTKTSSDAPVTGWESIVTGHKGDKYARSWFWGRKKAGRWAFETSDGTEVTSVALTPCGTFALIGSAGGSIDMFNLQSGIHRQKFPAILTPAQARKLKLQHASLGNTDLGAGVAIQKFNPGEGRHTRNVTGIMVDSLNKTVISCSLDGRLKFWDFSTGTLRHQVDWAPMTAITAARYHRSSDLVALSCDDLSIRVVDIETRKLVRELWGCVGQIKDFCFSNDGRWIIAASIDSVIRVWDLPTGHLIDAMRMEGTCTALAFSTTGEFLATAHADSIGINIWTNRSLFAQVSTRQLQEDDIVDAAGPTSSGENGQPLLAAAFDEEVVQDTEDGANELAATVNQLSKDMTTLSLVPRSRWQTLLHLDVISARNKPIEPPKAPEKAPFFLSSLDRPQLKSAQAESNTSDLTVSAAERSRISALQRNAKERPFSNLLQAAAAEPEPFITHLKSLSPSAADIEIRSLSPLATENELAAFVRAMTARLRQRRDYEVVQAWMAVFLRAHGDVIEQDEAALNTLREWRGVQEQEVQRLGQLAGYCNGVVAFLRSAR